jgi:hypothetical protein
MPIFGRRDNEPRSASEREAARLERERRRLEREGRGRPENGAAGAEPSGDVADEPSGGLWTGAPDDGAHAAGDAPAHPDAAQPAEPAPESVDLDEQPESPASEGVDPDEQPPAPAPESVDPPEQPEPPAPPWAGETAASVGRDAGDDPAQPAAPRAGDEVSPDPHEHAGTPERPPADERFERRHESDAVAWGAAAGDESDPRAGAWPAAQTPAAQAFGDSGRGESRADLESRGAGEGAGADGGGDAAGTPGPAGRAHDPDATQPFDALGTGDRRRTVSLPRPQTDTGEYDAPIGTVRVNRAGGYEAQPGASGYPAYRKLGVQKPRRRWLRRIVALLALLAVVAVAVFLYFLYQPAHGPGFGRVQVSIPQGATASQIGDILEKQGVVDSAFFFSLRARLSGKREQLRSGRYTLRQSMPYDAALTALTTAPKAAAVLNVTLPEGPSRRGAR